jgi:hypothetical protein
MSVDFLTVDDQVAISVDGGPSIRKYVFSVDDQNAREVKLAKQPISLSHFTTQAVKASGSQALPQ